MSMCTQCSYTIIYAPIKWFPPQNLGLPQVIGGDRHAGSVTSPTPLALLFGAKSTCEGGHPNSLGQAKSKSDVATNS